MAIIINGKTKCPICGDIIYKEQKIVGFPHFIGDEKDILFFFSDRAFHEKCFFNHSLANDVIKRLESLIIDDTTSSPKSKLE